MLLGLERASYRVLEAASCAHAKTRPRGSLHFRIVKEQSVKSDDLHRGRRPRVGPRKLVGFEGLEPSRLAALASETSAYANSARSPQIHRHCALAGNKKPGATFAATRVGPWVLCGAKRACTSPVLPRSTQAWRGNQSPTRPVRAYYGRRAVWPPSIRARRPAHIGLRTAPVASSCVLLRSSVTHQCRHRLHRAMLFARKAACYCLAGSGLRDTLGTAIRLTSSLIIMQVANISSFVDQLAIACTSGRCEGRH